MEWVYLTLAVICKSCRDVCLCNHSESIFSKFIFFKSDWTRAYDRINVGPDESYLQRRMWFGLIPIPHATLDGPHMFEWLLWLCVGISLYSCEGITVIDLLRIGILITLVHWAFYKHLLRRKFWKLTH